MLIIKNEFINLLVIKIIVHRLKPPAKKISKQKDKTSKNKKKKRSKDDNDDYDQHNDDEDEEDEDDCNVLFPCNRWFAKGKT